MPKRRETTITNEQVNILRPMRHEWELETEVNAFLKGNSELDAIVIERGREPVGIETKFATTTNAKNLITQAEDRLVLELEVVVYQKPHSREVIVQRQIRRQCRQCCEVKMRE